MEKKFNRFLSIVLALVMSSSTALTVSSETVSVESPDEPAVIEWTEETQTDEFEIRSDVVGEENEEKDRKEDVSSDSKPDKDKAEQAKPEAKADEAAAPEAKAEKPAVAPSGGTDNESAEGTTGDLKWRYDGETKTLTFSGEGEMENYESSYFRSIPWYSKDIETIIIEQGATSIGRYAFYRCKEVKRITIPDSITSIRDGAFYSCNGLTNITIPDSVTSIGSYAFSGCIGLTSITIPNSVTSIGSYAFSGCIGLTSITIPDSVTSIGSYAFSDCTGLTSIPLPDSITSIGEGMFKNCYGFTSITISDSVTRIGSYAFWGCMEMVNITIPDSVTSIGDGAFECCYRLTKVNLPDSVKEIGMKAFSSCRELKEISLPYGIKAIYYFTFSGCTSLTKITLPESLNYIGEAAFSNCDNLTSLTLPDSVKTIDSYAFFRCAALSKINIPNKVTKIQEYAFIDCESLKSITIPDSVTSIEECAFDGCTSLTSITIPGSVTSIGDRAFAGCKGLTSITIPDSVTSIGSYAFDGCTGLTSVTIPNSVKVLSGFSNCTGLTSITIPDSVTSIGSYAFDGCTGLTSVTIPNSVKVLSGFSNCTGLTNITIPDSVTSIGSDAFYHCTGLTSITIPDSVTSIGSDAFYHCTGLTSITIPDSVTSIGSDAFNGCKGLTSITISDSVTSIGSSAFYGCTGLTSITIPDSVTSIGSSAFSHCTGLTSITIPDSVTSIGSSAFSGCTSLTSITIPDSVTSIGSSAFSGCTSLTSITIPDSVTSIGSYAFRGCRGLTSITIPDSVTSIGYSAFSGCTALTRIIIPESVTMIETYAFSGCNDLTIYCVPGSKALEYATANNIPVEFIFESEYDGTLTLNLGEQYKGAKIRVVSHDQFGKDKIELVKLIDKTPVSFGGLDPTMTYKAEVYNDIGTIFGTFDNITLTDKYADITFTDLKEICDINVSVKDKNGSEVTDLCNIKWFNESGKYICTGTKLRNVGKGDVFKYTVEFKSSYLRDNYVLPSEQTVTAGSSNAECVLEAYPTLYFTGKVTDENGKAIAHAGVSLAQTLSSDNVKTVSGSTDENGSFMIYAKNMPTKLIVKKKGYEVFTEQLETLSEDVKNITINRVETAEVKLTVTTQELDKEAAETNSLGDMNFVLKNETTGKEINGFTPAPTALSLPLNEVSEGDEITVKVTSDGYESASASFVYGTDEAVSLSLVKRGKIVINRTSADLKLDMAVIFNGSGKYVSTVTMKKAKVSSDNLPADNYTVVMMNKNDRYYSPASLKEFNSYGLENGVDYTKAEVTVENAKTTTLDNVSVPVLDDSKTSYLDLSESSLTVNKTSLPLGQYFVFKVNYALDPAVTGLTNTSVVMSVPEELAANENCAAINGKTADFTLNDGEMIIPVTKKSGSVVVALKAMNACDFCTITAKLSFKANGKETAEAIGSVNCTVESFDYYLPETVNTTEVYSSGTTFANSSVEYYDNDILVGTTKTNASGSYEITFELNNPYKRSSHTIYALVTTPNGDVYKSAIKDLEYISDAAVANKLNVLHHGNGFEVNFNRSQTDNLYCSFFPAYPTFTFELDVSGDVSKVFEAEVVTKTPSGEYIHVPLKLDEKSGKFVGSYDYSAETRPTAISVSFHAEQELVLDYEQMMEKVDELEKVRVAFDEEFAAFNSSLEELQTPYCLSNEEFVESLKANGCSNETIASLDLDALVNSVNMSLDEFDREFEEYMQGIINSSIPEDMDNELSEILNNDLSTSNIRRLNVDESVTPEILMAEGYEAIKTYEDYALLFEKKTENGRSELVDLLQGSKYVYGTNKAPISSGECSCNCGPYPWDSSILLDKMKNLDRMFKKLKSFIGKTSTVANVINDGMNAFKYTHIDTPLILNDVIEGVQNGYDANTSSGIVKSIKDSYTKGSIKKFERATRGFGNIMKIAGKMCLFVDTFCDLIDFSEIINQILALQKECCKCTKIAIESINLAIKEVEYGLLKAAANIALDFVPYVNIVWGFVTTFVGLWGAITQPEPSPVLQPIEFSKKQAKMWLDYAKRFLEFECKCEEEDPVNEIPILNCVDPSGYICETVPSNRIEGVTATLFYSESSTGENAILWDASQYEQENPLLSDSNGHYEWYVPEGWWQVKFEKAGYETTYSDWVPVLPIQTEVNVEMKSLYAPTVENVNVFTDGIDITFSHYIDVDSISDENITVMMGETDVSGTVIPLNEEAGFSNSNVLYASKFRFIPDQTLSGDVTVNVEKIKASNGLYMDTPYSETKTAEEKIESVNVPENITMKYDASTDVEITLLPVAAGANKTISVRSSSDKLISVENNTVVTDENGKATVKITGHMPAHAELTFTVDGYDISAVTNVELSTNDPVDELAAALTITPEGSACFGKIVETKISINGGTAPYMYKLEMIDDNGESETLYTHHFHELSDDDSSMMFNKMCNKAGHFTFKATVTDAAGQVSTDTKEINVHQASITDITPDKTSAFVGDTIVFTPSTMHLSPDMAQYCKYKYTVTKDGVSTEFLYPEKSSLSFIPTKSGEYTIALTIADVLGNTIAEKTITYTVDDIAVDDVTIYYKGYANPNIHYRTAGGTWTTVPGVAMQQTDEIEGFTHKYTIALDGAEYAEVCFNDGNGNWDSRNGANYRFTKGNFTFANGVITPIEKPDFSASLALSDEIVPVNNSVTLTASTANGTEPYTYTFAYTRLGERNEIVTDNSSAICEFTPTEEGTYQIEVTAADADGNTATAVKTLTVKAPVITAVNTNVDSAYVGQSVQLSMDTQNSFDGITASFTVRNADTNELVAELSGNTAAWTPDSVGTYVITAQLSFKGAIVAENSTAFTVEEAPVPENTITIYYKGYANPNIHYQVGTGTWTDVPGVTMTPTNEVAGYTHKYTIDLGDADYANVCFNDGHNNWDSRNGANYRFTKGTYTFSNGTITAM